MRFQVVSAAVVLSLRWSLVALLSVVLACLVASCSLLNREGPDVTCADLRNGALKACENGIVASCINGKVEWEVCDGIEDCAATLTGAVVTGCPP